MKTGRFLSMVSAGVFLLAVSLHSQSVDPPPEPAPTYGSVEVTRVVQVEAACTLICDIDAFPPVVGRRIPVRLQGIEIPAKGVVSGDVMAFLQRLLIPENQRALPAILLKDIRRGDTFCLVADIEVNGQDLAGLLVENGLAQRVIRLHTDPAPQTAPPAAAAESIKSSGQTEATKQTGFVASRTGKVFHRPDCSHAKRIDPTRVVTFQTRQQAEQSGRRPCKTCAP